MTKAEILAEMEYRYAERIGILCADAVPSAAASAMAEAEVEVWLNAVQDEQQKEFYA